VSSEPHPDEVAHLAQVRRLYGTALREGLNDAERVGWESTAVQRVRFESLLQALAPGDLDASTRLLDVGCGLGDLYGYLAETGREVDYTGIDVLPAMIEEARERHPGARFEVRDLLEMDTDRSWDVVICSGGLSASFGDEATSWMFIERLYELSNWVTAFNVQSDRDLAQHGVRELRSDFWYVAPEVLLERLQPLARDVVIREDVVPSDCTVYLYHRGYSRTARVMGAALSPVGRAELHLQRDEYGEAIRALESGGDPEGDERIRAQFLEGVARAFLGQLDRAEDCLSSAYAEAPHDLDVARSLLHLHLVQSDVAAGADIALALDGAEAHAAARDDLRLMVHQHARAAGEADIVDALEAAAETGFATSMMHAANAMDSRVWREAEAHLERALAARPGDGRPRPHLARIYLETGRSAKALEECLAVLAASPGHPSARETALNAMRRLARAAATQVRDGVATSPALQTLESLTSHPVLGPVASRLCASLSS